MSSNLSKKGKPSEPIETVRLSMQRIFKRYEQQRKSRRTPKCSCEKCGSSLWGNDDETVWYCFRCGNRGFWDNGIFRQSGGGSCSSE